MFVGDEWIGVLFRFRLIHPSLGYDFCFLFIVSDCCIRSSLFDRFFMVVDDVFLRDVSAWLVNEQRLFLLL